MVQHVSTDGHRILPNGIPATAVPLSAVRLSRVTRAPEPRHEDSPAGGGGAGRTPRPFGSSPIPHGPSPSTSPAGGGWLPPPPHRRRPEIPYSRNASSLASSTSRSPPPRSVAEALSHFQLPGIGRAYVNCVVFLQAPVIYSPAYDISFLGLEKL